MSSNARRRSVKIVAPQETNREQELIGGLKNALLRGENITKAKQSFISAGYKPEEIEAAARKISVPPKNNQQKSETPGQSQKPTEVNPAPKKQISKKLIIILVAISALILIASALVGIFWNKKFT